MELVKMIKREIKECKMDRVDYSLEVIGEKFLEYGYTEKEITEAYKKAAK